MKFIESMKAFIRSVFNKVDVWKLNLNRNIQIGQFSRVRMAEIEDYVKIGDFCNIQRGGSSYSYLGN